MEPGLNVVLAKRFLTNVKNLIKDATFPKSDITFKVFFVKKIRIFYILENGDYPVGKKLNSLNV